MAGPQCGKSCLVTRLRFNEFVEVEDPTIRKSDLLLLPVPLCSPGDSHEVTCGGGGGGAEDDHVHTLTVNDKQYTLKIRDISGDLALYSEFYPNVLLHSPLCVGTATALVVR